VFDERAGRVDDWKCVRAVVLVELLVYHLLGDVYLLYLAVDHAQRIVVDAIVLLVYVDIRPRRLLYNFDVFPFLSYDHPDGVERDKNCVLDAFFGVFFELLFHLFLIGPLIHPVGPDADLSVLSRLAHLHAVVLFRRGLNRSKNAKRRTLLLRLSHLVVLLLLLLLMMLLMMRGLYIGRYCLPDLALHAAFAVSEVGVVSRGDALLENVEIAPR